MWTDKGNLSGPFRQHAELLAKYGLTPEQVMELQVRWNELNRCYHSQEHLEFLLDLLDPKDVNYDILVLVAFFHDVVYNPTSKTNEEDSVKLFESMVKADDVFKMQAVSMILDTKDHTAEPSAPNKELSKYFLELDIYNLLYGSVADMIEVERKMFREFGMFDFQLYKAGRKQFLDKFVPYVKKVNPNSKIDEYAKWFETHQPRIAVFAGTFFPFHLGHYDILKKAEKTFDKVIVLTCINPSKSNDLKDLTSYVENELPKKLPNNQVEIYKGMLHQFVEGKPYPLTIVKGLRNPSDFDSEKLQLRYMEDLSPDINVVYIVSDRKYEHVSSSGVKQIKMFGLEDEANKYLP